MRADKLRSLIGEIEAAAKNARADEHELFSLLYDRAGDIARATKSTADNVRSIARVGVDGGDLALAPIALGIVARLSGALRSVDPIGLASPDDEEPPPGAPAPAPATAPATGTTSKGARAARAGAAAKGPRGIVRAWPKHCHVSPCGTVESHKRNCRPGRPLCRWRRAPSKCGCDAYHYPHRRNGGLCNETNRWIAQYGRAA